MRPASRVIDVQMRKRFPAATETKDFDVVLAAAIRGTLDNGIESGDITATGKHTDTLYSHHCPFSSRNGQADAAALSHRLPRGSGEGIGLTCPLEGGEPVNVRFGS